MRVAITRRHRCAGPQASLALPSTAKDLASVFRWHFRTVDDQHLDRLTLRLQLQPELLLQRREEIGLVWIDRGHGDAGRQHSGRRSRWPPLQLEIELLCIRQAGAIEYGPID